MKRVKGSTVCIALMFATWVGYLIACFAYHSVSKTWPPAELTYATCLLFVVETWQLARFKLAKERGSEDRAKAILAEENTFISGKTGIATASVVDDLKEITDAKIEKP